LNDSRNEKQNQGKIQSLKLPGNIPKPHFGFKNHNSLKSSSYESEKEKPRKLKRKSGKTKKEGYSWHSSDWNDDSSELNKS
jgi:hypothetical protein